MSSFIRQPTQASPFESPRPIYLPNLAPPTRYLNLDYLFLRNCFHFCWSQKTPQKSEILSRRRMHVLSSDPPEPPSELLRHALRHCSWAFESLEDQQHAVSFSSRLPPLEPKTYRPRAITWVCGQASCPLSSTDGLGNHSKGGKSPFKGTTL